MGDFLRRTVMWLIILALPVQGIAAVAMNAGGPGDSAVIISTQASPVSPGHCQAGGTHGSAAGASSGTGLATGWLGDAEAGAVSGTSVSALSGQHDSSACTPWCVSAGLPPVPVSVDPSAVSASVYPAPAAFNASFFRGGLDRPPRPLRA